jgi:hypothetical protein
LGTKIEKYDLYMQILTIYFDFKGKSGWHMDVFH